MPNFARFLINILLYIFYVLVIIGLGSIVIHLLLIALGFENPRLSTELYDLIVYIGAGIILLFTLLFRRSCYLSFKKYSDETQSFRYTESKKGDREKKKKKQKHKQEQKNNLESDSERDSDGIKIYVDKEIK